MSCVEENDHSDGDFSSLDLESIPIPLSDPIFCASLTELFLDYNTISDLPSALFECVENLTVFSAVGNELKQLPDTIGKMRSLQKLFLQENQLGALPETIGGFSQLKVLNIVGNRVQSLPDTISDLSALEEIFLDENQLQILPVSFVKLSSLQVLEVSDNMLGSLPEDIGNLSALKVLNVSGNNLEDSLPESFGDLTNICTIDLSHNQLSQLPSKCCFHNTLVKLFAEQNVLQSLPDWVNNLPNIKHLSFRDNVLRRDPFSEAFGETSKHLKVFDISGNFITRLPESIGNLKKLEKFCIGSVICELERRNFQNGNWIDQLPARFSQMTMLKVAHLDENQINELPHEFGCLVNLEFLDLGQNQLRHLPDSFCQLRSLKVCQLSKNRLQNLPENLGQLRSLIDLRLDNNQLSEIPASLSEVTQLQSLDLFHNLFTTMPSCVSKLTNLIRLDVYENQFEMNWWEVPNIHTRAKYTPKDPALSDNWRGRYRDDHIELSINEMSISKNAEVAEETEESKDDSQNWNYYQLRDAARRNMSLWKSHSSKSSKREKFFHKTKEEVEVKEEVVEEEEDDDWECPNVVENNAAPLEPFITTSPAIVYDDSPTEEQDFPDGEDWESEMVQPRLLDPHANGLLMVHKPWRPNYGIPEEHIFVPGDSHVGNFHRTSKVNPIFATNGQFEDLN